MNDVKLTPISLTEIHYFISKRQHGTAFDVCVTALNEDPPDDYIDEYKFWKAFTMSDSNEGRRLITKIVANDGEYDAPEAIVAALAHLVLVPDSTHPSTPAMKEQFKTALKGCSMVALRNVTRYFLLTARLEKARQCVDRLVAKSPSPAVTAHSLAGHVYLTQALVLLPFASIAYVPVSARVPSLPSDTVAPAPPEEQLRVAAQPLAASLDHFTAALAHMAVGRARDPLGLLGRSQHHAIHRAWTEALKDLKRLHLIAPHCVAQADEKLRLTCAMGLPQWPAVAAVAQADLRACDEQRGSNARVSRWTAARMLLLYAALREGSSPDALVSALSAVSAAAAQERPRGTLLAEVVQSATRAAWVTHGDAGAPVFRAAAKALLPVKTDAACASEVAWQHLHLARPDKAAATFDKLVRHLVRAGSGPAPLHTHVGLALSLSLLPANAAPLADPDSTAAPARWPSPAEAMDALRGCAADHPALGYWQPLLAATASLRSLPEGSIVLQDGSVHAIAVKQFRHHTGLCWPLPLSALHAAAWHPDATPPAVLVQPGAAPLALHDSYELVEPADAAALEPHRHFMLPAAAAEHLLNMLSLAARVYQRVHGPAIAAQRPLLAQDLVPLLDLHFPLWLGTALLAVLQSIPLGDTRANARAPALHKVLRDAAACVTIALSVAPHARQLHLVHLLLVRARVLEMRAAQFAAGQPIPAPDAVAAGFRAAMVTPAPGEPDIGPCLARLSRAPDGSIRRPVLLLCETRVLAEPIAPAAAASAPTPVHAPPVAGSVQAPGPLSVMAELAELLGDEDDDEAAGDDEDGAHFALATQRSPTAYREFKAMVAQHAKPGPDPVEAASSEGEDSFDSGCDDIPELRDSTPSGHSGHQPAPDTPAHHTRPPAVMLPTTSLTPVAHKQPRLQEPEPAHPQQAQPDMLVGDVEEDEPRPAPEQPAAALEDDDHDLGEVPEQTPEQAAEQADRDARDRARVSAELASMKPLKVVRGVAFPQELVSPASEAAVAAEAESARRWAQATEFVRAALIGDMFLKYGRHGQPHHRSVVVRIMPDNRTVCVDWGTGQLRFHKNNARILEGAQSGVFQKAVNRKTCVPERCFSVVTAERSLDLEATSEGDRDYWVQGMRLLLAFLWD